MTKRDLRKLFKHRRSLLSLDEVDQASLDIANQVLKLDIWDHHFYHLFLSIEEYKEVQTDYLLHILQGKDRNVVVAKSNFKDCSMSHYLLTDQMRLVKSQYNIPEPPGDGLIPISEQEMDVVFVPLLAADQSGNRIGYGKGFYDRFLKKCRPETVKIGLSFFEPIEDSISADENDAQLDYLVTPGQIFEF